MPRRPRCNSNWNKISVIDDSGDIVQSFDLDKLGQIITKIERQKRRKIHIKGNAAKQGDIPTMKLPETENNPKLVFDLENIFITDNNKTNQQNVENIDNCNKDISKESTLKFPNQLEDDFQTSNCPYFFNENDIDIDVFSISLLNHEDEESNQFLPADFFILPGRDMMTPLFTGSDIFTDF